MKKIETILDNSNNVIVISKTACFARCQRCCCPPVCVCLFPSTIKASPDGTKQ